MNRLRVGGVILCGGQSKRMGQPKAWLRFGEEFMLDRIVRLLGEVVQPLVVVAAADQAVPPLAPEVGVIRDTEMARGPLHGIAQGLEALKGSADAAYVTSCDVPFLQKEFVLRLIELLGDHAICVPKIGDFHHPLAAIYRVHVAAKGQALLSQNRLRPIFLFDMVPTRVVAPAELIDVDPDFLTLRNLNSPEDYQAALRDLPQR